MSSIRPLEAGTILEALASGDVKFIVIGGLAVGAHGHPRGTKDIDIVPAPDRDNLARLAAVLVDLDYEVAGTEEFDPDEIVRPDLDGLLAGGNWVLMTRYGGLDILQFVEPDLDYEALSPNTIEAEVLGVAVRFCGYDDLVAMKEHAGRPVDMADLDALRQIRGED